MPSEQRDNDWELGPWGSAGAVRTTAERSLRSHSAPGGDVALEDPLRMLVVAAALTIGVTLEQDNRLTF